MTDSLSLQHIIATLDTKIFSFLALMPHTVTAALNVWRLRSDLHCEMCFSYSQTFLCHFACTLALVCISLSQCRCSRTNRKWWRIPAITITANASQEAAVPHQFVQAEPGVQVNQCFNIIEECRYVMTISSALCLYAQHVPRWRCDCCDCCDHARWPGVTESWLLPRSWSLVVTNHT